MQRKSAGVFYILFTLSGFSGLIYESIWSHYLKLFLGHAAYAQSLVLAIFMGGMALGSFVTSRYSLRWKNLLKGYAITEGIIGLCALIFHFFFDYVVNLSYTSVFPALQSPAAVNAYKWTLSALIILPQSVLLGMTFPLMTSGILRIFPEKPGKTISLLYFTNSIGAAVGVLVSGFLLIGRFGLPGTIMFAGVINIILALFVLKLMQGYEVTAAPEPSVRGEDASRRSGFYVLLLSASLLTGLASFIYEIGWIRMLSLVLGSSTHAFELMLSAFILGLAFGGLWIQKRIDRLSRPITYLVMVQVVMGICALSSLPLYGGTFKIMQMVMKSLPKTDGGYALFNLSSHAIAIAVMLPATFCAGMTLPLITFLLMKNGYGERSIGAVYASNTVGAIIGVFFAIHGMPVLGLKGLLITGGSVDIGLGLLLLWVLAEKREDTRIPAAITAVSIAAVLVVAVFVRLDHYKMASGIYLSGGGLMDDRHELRYYKDGKTASVSVSYYKKGKVLTIRTNGKPDASMMTDYKDGFTIDAYTQILSAVIPMAYHPGAKSIANVGIGSGLTTNTVLANPRLTQVDTIEIEKSMVEGARYFGDLVTKVFNDPRSRIYIDDAKTFFSAYNKRYDIIISEPSNPWVSGVASLFSEEFYRMVKRHLSPDGLFVQWMQLYDSNPVLVASVMKAIQNEFDDCVIYTPNGIEIIIIAKPHGSLGSPDREFLGMPEIKEVLGKIGITSTQDIMVRRVGDKKVMENYFGSFSTRPNSDYYPVLDQRAPKARYLVTNAYEVVSHNYEPLPINEMLSRIPSDDYSDVSPSRFPLTTLITNALSLRDYLMRGNFGEGAEGLNDELRFLAAEVRKAFVDCRSTPHPRRQEYVFTVLKSTAPYLRPKEADAMFDYLAAQPCYRSLTEIEKKWVSLFRSVGRRDAPEMVNGSSALLQEQERLSKRELQYAVAAAMLGNISMGKKEEALQVWFTYKPILFENVKFPAVFALLLANTL